jgi:hypothetical protein
MLSQALTLTRKSFQLTMLPLHTYIRMSWRQTKHHNFKFYAKYHQDDLLIPEY